MVRLGENSEVHITEVETVKSQEFNQKQLTVGVLLESLFAWPTALRIHSIPQKNTQCVEARRFTNPFLGRTWTVGAPYEADYGSGYQRVELLIICSHLWSIFLNKETQFIGRFELHQWQYCKKFA